MNATDKLVLNRVGMIAAATGLGVAAVAVVDKPGSPFLSVAGQVGLLSFSVNFLLPLFPLEQRAAMIGAGMAVLCKVVHGFQLKSSAQYGAVAGIAAYASSLFLEPVPETEDKKVKPLKQA